MIEKIINNPWWRLSIDILQIISVFGLSGLGILKIIPFISKSPIFIAFLFVLVILLVLWLRGGVVEIIRKVKREKIKMEASNIKKEFEKDFSKGLPSNAILKSWFLNAEKRVKNWDPRSTLTSLDFYLYRGAGILLEPRFQAIYNSEWKNLAGTFYVPSKLDVDDIEEISYQSNKQVRPFFLQYPNWKKVLIRAYEMINDSLPTMFKLQIVSGDEIRFYFRYIQGNIRKKESFSYDGKLLVNKKLDRSLKI